MSIAVMALLGLLICLGIALGIINVMQARRERHAPRPEDPRRPRFYDHSARS